MLEDQQHANNPVVAVEHCGSATSGHYTGFARGRIPIPSELKRLVALAEQKVRAGGASSSAGGPSFQHLMVHVKQEEGLCVRVRNGLGFIELAQSGGGVEVVGYLPAHPNQQHHSLSQDLTCVLPMTVAEGVLEPLQLPSDPDPSCIYEGVAYATGHQEGPFVRAIWFTPEMADTVCGRNMGTHQRVTDTLHELWYRNSRGKMTCDAVQPAAGAYSEMGVGVLPGVGRASLIVDGVCTNVPFPRNSALSDLIEPHLGDFMSDVSRVVHGVLANGGVHPVALHGMLEMRLARAYQYPRLRMDAGCIPSHQVVIRGPKFKPDRGHSEDFEAFLSASDLHTDPWDGGGELGSCTVHTCRRVAGTELVESQQEQRHLRLRGLACFPTAGGGRGVHIASMVPGWHCAILMQTAKRLHGSVVACESVPRPLALEGKRAARPCEARESRMKRIRESDMMLRAVSDPVVNHGSSLPNMQMMRVVTYPLRRIELLLERLARDPCKEGDVLGVSHPWIVQRASAKTI